MMMMMRARTHGSVIYCCMSQRNWLKSSNILTASLCLCRTVSGGGAITIIIMRPGQPQCLKDVVSLARTHSLARFMYTCPYSSDLINRPHSFLHLRSLRGNLLSLLSVFPIAQPSPSLTYQRRCTNHTYLYSIWQNTIGTCVSCPRSCPVSFPVAVAVAVPVSVPVPAASLHWRLHY